MTDDSIKAAKARAKDRQADGWLGNQFLDDCVALADEALRRGNRIKILETALRRFESECRNELGRGKLMGYEPDGVHSELWTGLRHMALAALEPGDL